MLQMFRQLLPPLLMLTENGGVVTTSPLPLSLVTSSKHAFTFVDHVIQTYGRDSYDPLKKLIQHLCTKVPDRAEYRSKVALVRHKYSLAFQLPSPHVLVPLPLSVSLFQTK